MAIDILIESLNAKSVAYLYSTHVSACAGMDDKIGDKGDSIRLAMEGSEIHESSN